MFPYELFTLIECVENKPCLWDKTIEEYKDKILKRNSWNEVCKILEPDYDKLEEKKKTELYNSVIHKWNNIRDAFKKSLIKKSGQSQKKNYIYHNQLQFWLKVLNPDETISSIPPESDSNRDSTSTGENDSTTPQNRPSTSQPNECLMPGNKKKRMNPVDAEILKILQKTPETTNLLESDEDTAFLFSVLPAIKRLPEDDRMAFKIDVMQLIRKYTNRLRMARHSSPTGTGTTLIMNGDESSSNIIQVENENLYDSFVNESQDSIPAIYLSVVESETETAVNDHDK